MIRILFVGTTNTYRSRFAEAYLNHKALNEKLPITSYSVGLKTDREKDFNVDRVLYPYFEELGIQTDSIRKPTSAKDFHFENFDQVIALDESEHREMMRNQFPEWENKISYWMVHDQEHTTPTKALEKIKVILDQYIEQEIKAFH